MFGGAARDPAKKPAKGTAYWRDRALDTGLVSLQLGENGANLQDWISTFSGASLPRGAVIVV